MPAGPAGPHCRSQPCQPAPETYLLLFFFFFSKELHVTMYAAHLHELQPVSKSKYPANSILMKQAALGVVHCAAKFQTDQQIGTYHQTICNDCSAKVCLSCSGAPDMSTAATSCPTHGTNESHMRTLITNIHHTQPLHLHNRWHHLLCKQISWSRVHYALSSGLEPRARTRGTETLSFLP